MFENLLAVFCFRPTTPMGTMAPLGRMVVHHTCTKMIPYEAVYGQRPPTITSYLPSRSKVQSIDTMLKGCTTTLSALKDNLHMAQNRMKQHVDQRCSERVFQEGNQVFLRLQPYKKSSLKSQGHHKLAPKFYGPYQIIKHIGLVA
jgi:hypothetical protein